MVGGVSVWVVMVVEVGGGRVGGGGEDAKKNVDLQ